LFLDVAVAELAVAEEAVQITAQTLGEAVVVVGLVYGDL
jgi:hypothetical protein